jgi:hypothetical protein
MFADVVGMAGVLAMLVAYAAAQFQRLDPLKAPSLAMNFGGACLVLYSLTQKFNLAAFIMEAAWAAVALFGLIRIALRRPKPRA